MNLRRHASGRQGFTLVEIMFASSITLLVAAGVLSFFVTSRKLWYPSALTMSASLRGGATVSKIIHGAGTDTFGLRAARANTVWQWSDGDSWTVGYNTNQWVMYNGTSNTVYTSVHGMLCRNVVKSTATVSSASCAMTFFVTDTLATFTVTNRFDTRISFRN